MDALELVLALADSHPPPVIVTTTLSTAMDAHCLSLLRAATMVMVTLLDTWEMSISITRRTSPPEPTGSPMGLTGSPHASPRSCTLLLDLSNGPTITPSTLT
jgi:hypothetical protein